MKLGQKKTRTMANHAMRRCDPDLNETTEMGYGVKLSKYKDKVR